MPGSDETTGHSVEVATLPYHDGNRSRQLPADSGWTHFPHSADIGVCGWGPTTETAFEQAALALTRIVTDSEIRALSSVTISCTAIDLELLLIEWLDAIVYEMAVRRMLFGEFAVSIDDLHLRATIQGEAVDIARHAPAVEPKGATFTALHVYRRPDASWVAACVIDV